jgi:hypothetical protein
MDGFLSGWQNYEELKINKAEDQIKNKENKYRLSVVNFVKQHPEYLDALLADGQYQTRMNLHIPLHVHGIWWLRYCPFLTKMNLHIMEELVKGCMEMPPVICLLN